MSKLPPLETEPEIKVTVSRDTITWETTDPSKESQLFGRDLDVVPIVNCPTCRHRESDVPGDHCFIYVRKPLKCWYFEERQ